MRDTWATLLRKRTFAQQKTDVKKHEILSPQSRAALFDPPTDPAAIVRNYTFSPDDMALIRERRRAANRLGFAVQLAYFRHPGRVMRVDEEPPEDMLTFIAGQVHADVDDFRDYAGRAQTRREHIADLQACLNIRLARRADARPLFSVALNEAIGSDRGDAIVLAMIVHLRASCILLPSPLELERVALSARALARKRAHKNPIEGLSPETMASLQGLLVVADDEERTPFVWLREWPEAPRQRNLVALVERLEAVRKLGVGADRETRIHRARYAAIAREIAILVRPRDIARFETPRRLATLVVFAREMEAVLTDATLAMFDKMLGAVFRRADRAHKDNLVDRARTLDASARVLLGMAKAMLAAKEKGEDQVVRRRTLTRLGTSENLGRRDGIGRRRFAPRQSRRDRQTLRELAANVARHPWCFRLPIMEGARSAAHGARRGARASCERREETSAAGADGLSAADMAQGRQRPPSEPIAGPMRSRS